MKQSILTSTFVFLTIGILLSQPSSQYKLVFSDEFNDGVVDLNTWWLAGTTGCATHGSGACEEAMWYRPNNVTESSGTMQINSKAELFGCNNKIKSYTSGWASTAAEFKYGYFEIRAKVPSGAGLWPAFWLFSNANTLSYQEID